MVGILKRRYSLNRLVSRKISNSSEHELLLSATDDRVQYRSQGTRTFGPMEAQKTGGAALDCSSEMESKSRPSEIEMMKEKFAKLLLGEDMSGGGRGVSSALALSNAITNLAASVFGEQRRLEPMAEDRRTRWKREIDWLLSVTDYIVEFVAVKQVGKDGSSMDIMTTQQRRDLHMNIPALRKLDGMLMEYLDNFRDQNEFWYVSKSAQDSEKKREDDKWWIPTVKVPPNGLSDVTRKWLQYQKELVNQVHKAALAINANVVMEMEVPENYIESLPKNGRSSLGDSIYKSITDDSFNPEEFLSTIDLSTEHKIVDLKDRIEASVVIWKRKMNNKDMKSTWGSAVSIGKREQFEERAETILLILKHRFPGSSQSQLDISKIQFNKDVGLAVRESYSRVLESLAFTVMSRIEDVLYADSLAQDPTLESSKRRPLSTDSESVTTRPLNPIEEIEKLKKMEASKAMTLSDFMDWHMDQGTETFKKETNHSEEASSSEDGLMKKLLGSVVNNKKFSYIESLEILGGLKSPKARR